MKVDLHTQAVPLLQLVRSALLMDDMLREIDDSRAIEPDLDAALKKLRLATSLGSSINDELVRAVGLAIELIEADRKLSAVELLRGQLTSGAEA